VPSPAAVQSGFRLSELLPQSQSGLTSGVTTFHFSLIKDLQKPLNLSHEYQLAFVTTNDGTHVFEIKYGTRWFNSSSLPSVDVNSADRLLLMDTNTIGYDKTKVLFAVPFTPNKFHNFAVTIDWDKATLAAYYSQYNDPLQMVVPVTANPLKKPGEFHVGILKLPVGAAQSVVFHGFQDAGIQESIIYGGIFVEDSTDGTVTTEPMSYSERCKLGGVLMILQCFYESDSK